MEKDLLWGEEDLVDFDLSDSGLWMLDGKSVEMKGNEKDRNQQSFNLL